MKAYLFAAMALGATSVSAHQFYSSDYEFVKSETLSLSTQEITRLKIDAGAGSLSLVGTDTNEINVKADIYQSEASSDYCLDLQGKGSVAKLQANVCHMKNNHTLIHLTVSLPRALVTKIKDGSGSIKARDVSIEFIDDGSGSIEIRDNLTSLEIEDGSGTIELMGVKGALKVDDGSGKLLAEDIEGDVMVEDGSGNVVIENVTGKVSVDDGSGNITVTNAEAFELLDDGSGKVKLYDIKNR
ncbi:hypothetical protein [Pseudoalteromonas luteoviolacea]|uniref:Adhesin domain-containing protein n=1 Tax=Pseudoalteromonas luteoviolacea DSM 6061 TaxID=1365250 RepID=A0A166XVT0_9GAMM|nr:hypothetical protein [Pseudoalteromonas luteoviolacea]KZN40961.1 hypothetical protein N475_00875 [Pseudoalteromonas luteoviolacea DSM 6061]KZN56415.1 hypothetical protein N474_11760 [Pseudoalteromonas luteoviolacea CPMOR-2]MBE0386321.1 hypothetical protein [Pseudoalteromonas luteoviolacea DSM 6061]TQF71200.1 hypothetical protein FLM44_08950 [Pseudoalteromonas luteoviolacea]